MQKINLNFFKKNIAAIQAYNEKIKQKEKLKYYKKFDLFKNFCNIFKIEIDNFDLKSQLCTMILFYLYLSNSHCSELYEHIHDIQAIFYKIENKNAKLKNKNILIENINKIISILSKKNFWSIFSKEDNFLEILYNNSIEDFISFLKKNKVEKKLFCSIEKYKALLIIILFYQKILLEKHTWYIIDVRIINTIEFYEDNTNEFICDKSFYSINNITFINEIKKSLTDEKKHKIYIKNKKYEEEKKKEIIKINENKNIKIKKKEVNEHIKNENTNKIDLHISDKKSKSKFQENIQIISKKIYDYNLKLIDKAKCSEYYFPKCREFNDFLKTMKDFKYIDIKSQLYLIILFYLDIDDKYKTGIYNTIMNIQKILFYKKKELKDKCLLILNEKYILHNVIKDMVNEILKKKYENDAKSIYICDSVVIKEFDIFLEENNTNREKLKNYDKQKVLAIVIFFYSYLMITKYNWCFIYINENVDVIENLYGKNGNISTEYRIKKTFFNIDKNDADVFFLVFLFKKYLNEINKENKNIKEKLIKNKNSNKIKQSEENENINNENDIINEIIEQKEENKDINNLNEKYEENIYEMNEVSKEHENINKIEKINNGNDIINEIIEKKEENNIINENIKNYEDGNDIINEIIEKKEENNIINENIKNYEEENNNFSNFDLEKNKINSNNRYNIAISLDKEEALNIEEDEEDDEEEEENIGVYNKINQIHNKKQIETNIKETSKKIDVLNFYNEDKKNENEREKEQIFIDIHKKIKIYREYEKEIKFYILGMFVFYLYFYFMENNTICLIILFLIGNILLYFFCTVCQYNIYIICFCYFLLSLSINCFRIKYFIPFLAAAISRYLVFINIFLIIDFNLYSFLFILINILFSFGKITKKKNIYILLFFSELILLIEHLNIKSLKLSFYFILLFFDAFCLYYKKKDFPIFFLVYGCFLCLRSVYNYNLLYEFNEIGLQLTVLNYSLTFSLILIENTPNFENDNNKFYNNLYLIK